MNRVILGILCGIAFGLLDAAMVVFGKHPDKSLAMLLQAFFSRFAIGFLAANVSLRIHPAISGALVGLLISLPDAFAMKSYVGIVGWRQSSRIGKASLFSDPRSGTAVEISGFSSIVSTSDTIPMGILMKKIQR